MGGRGPGPMRRPRRSRPRTEQAPARSRDSTIGLSLFPLLAQQPDVDETPGGPDRCEVLQLCAYLVNYYISVVFLPTATIEQRAAVRRGNITEKHYFYRAFRWANVRRHCRIAAAGSARDVAVSMRRSNACSAPAPDRTHTLSIFPLRLALLRERHRTLDHVFARLHLVERGVFPAHRRQFIRHFFRVAHDRKREPH